MWGEKKTFLVLGLILVLTLMPIVSANVFSSFFNKFQGKISGEVVTAPDTILCSDSDDGKDRLVRGFVKDRDGNTFYDNCVSDEYVKEWYCDYNNNVVSENMLCGFGYTCINGACVFLGTSINFCSDSDGGQDKFVKGSITDTNGNTYDDVCVGDDFVLEWYCDSEGRAVDEEFNCDPGYTCFDGACVEDDPMPMCFDSDEGQYERVKGYVRDKYGNTYEDVCEGSEDVLERYCGSNGEMLDVTIECFSGYVCDKGACVPSMVPIEFCSDSDDGKDELVRGVVTDVNGNEYSDVCVGDDFVLEWYCNDGKATDEKINCDSGYTCVDGACVESECIDSCSVGEVVCKDNMVYTCGNYDKDECLEMGYLETCAKSQTCENGKCVNVINSFCSETDSGMDYYQKGKTYGYVGSEDYSLEDTCLKDLNENSIAIDANSLREFFCNKDEMGYIDYKCENGCSEGRCLVNTITDDGNEDDYDGVVLVEEGFLNFGGNSFSINEISKDFVEILVNDEVVLQKAKEGEVIYYEIIKINVSKILFSENLEEKSKVVLNFDNNISYNGDCFKVLNLMDEISRKDFSSFSLIKKENAEVKNINFIRDSYLIDNRKENYEKYSIYFEENNPIYDLKKKYNIQMYVFENEEIDLMNFILDEEYDKKCSIREILMNGKTHQLFACKKTESTINNSVNDFTIFVWYKNNVYISVLFEEGSEFFIKDQDLKRVFTFVKEMGEESYDYSHFSLSYSQKKVLENLLNRCNSDLNFSVLDLEIEKEPNWNCILEPSVCPSSGQQIERCMDLEGIFEEKTRVVSCSPGSCSGCIIPGYYNLFGWDNQGEEKCMPYGARFQVYGGESKKIYNFEKNYSHGYSILKILDRDRLKFEVVEGNELIIDEKMNLGNNYNFLIGGEEVVFSVDEIFYSAKKPSDSYAVLNFIEEKNSYCDYDGEIKEQKERKEDGSWAECQNNFECKSNVCSAGECMEVQDMLAEISGFKGIFVKLLCRLSSLFGAEGSYQQCLSQYN